MSEEDTPAARLGKFVAEKTDRRRFLYRAAQGTFYGVAMVLAKGKLFSAAYAYPSSCNSPTGTCCPFGCGPSPCCGSGCSNNGCTCSGSACASGCTSPGTWSGQNCWTCVRTTTCTTTNCCDCQNASGNRCICSATFHVCGPLQGQAFDHYGRRLTTVG